ncbi:MAG: CDC48 family AAA ATPase [Candidatus Heimdallarchaeota archaeon]|nr:CDC48 family AAA ATPase [Candidatus Heimdallarchaeota archaeon]
MPTKPPSITLKVAEARQRDIGRQKVRIDGLSMRQINVTTGDVVEIKGKKTTAAIAWPAYPEDQNAGLIRMDKLLRNNADVGLSEKVEVTKANAKNAKTVTLAPFQTPVAIDYSFENFVKRKLLGYPLTEEDTVLIPILGKSLPFTVTSTNPKGIIRITEDTELKVIDKPVQVSDEALPRTSYEDIGGLGNQIQRIREMVELPMKHPELFKKLGIDPPKGVLLHGPPGCGKTLIAKAVANESASNFVTINGPEIMSKFYGESEQRLRSIFKDASAKAPTIIFIDELDAIASKRAEVTGEVERRVVAQLLALMDGMVSRGEVMVVGATNRPNAIDPALRRPGRFDREIEIGVPDRDGRREILLIHSRGMPLAPDVNLDLIAEKTHGYVGADLQALCREAAMKALRKFLPDIDYADKIITPELLDILVVNQDDILSAMKEIQPSAIREVFTEIPNIHWSDVGGLDEQIRELKEAIEWPLKFKESFSRMGISPPRGILLFGPPGCGKTLLAKAVATESEVNFISIKGPEVMSKWVGESEKAVREIFRKAKMSAPTIVFFDEIDALAPKRGSGLGDSGSTERVISQLLTEIDGLEMIKQVVIIAATNRPDIIDSALLRPGRFDRFVLVPPPDQKARLKILEIFTKNMPIEEIIDLKNLAKEIEGFSGADIEALCREAGMLALREDMNKDVINQEHFDAAKNKVQASITADVLKYYEKAKERLKRSSVEVSSLSPTI